MNFLKDLFPSILSSEDNFYQWTVDNQKRLLKIFNDGQEPADD